MASETQLNTYLSISEIDAEYLTNGSEIADSDSTSQMATNMVTLSDLYMEDVPEGSILISQYPTSCDQYADGEIPNPFFVNESSFNIYDHFEIPGSRYYNELIPHRVAAVVGSHLKLNCARQPSAEISRHWAKKLGEKVSWSWGFPGQESKPHVVLFPLEKLRPELHSVDPEKLYHVFSKFFIPEIACPQARVLNPKKPEFPCVVKAAFGAGSEGTFMVPSREEYGDVMAHIANTEPDCGVIVCEMVKDIIANYCCQFYLNSRGEMRWLGVTEQLMDENTGLWLGACVCSEKQASLEKLLKPTLVPVAQKLHEWGYFGVVGVDVLVSKDGSHNVIDINPRINGSTPLLLASRVLAGRGWKDGVFITGVNFRGTISDLIECAESVKTGEIVVFAASERGDDIICQVGVFSNSLDNCRELYHTVFKRIE